MSAHDPEMLRDWREKYLAERAMPRSVPEPAPLSVQLATALPATIRAALIEHGNEEPTLPGDRSWGLSGRTRDEARAAHTEWAAEFEALARLFVRRVGECNAPR